MLSNEQQEEIPEDEEDDVFGVCIKHITALEN